MPELNEETKKMVGQFQTFQQQLQSVLIQKESLRLQNLEAEGVLEELDKTQEKVAFKITGNIMVKKPVTEIKKELNENKEALELKIKSLEDIEKRLNTKLKDLEEKLKNTTE